MPIFETDNQLVVSTDGTAGPYIVATPRQVASISKALRTENIHFTIDHDAVMMDGAPALAVINLGNTVNVEQVQRVLDRVAATQKSRQRVSSKGRQGLVIRGDHQSMNLLMGRLDAEEAGGWSRKPEIEIRLRSSLRSELAGFCFGKHVAAINRTIVVLFGFRQAADVVEMYVFGVVPQDSGTPLSPADHDTVIADVKKSLLEPLVCDLPVRLVLRRVSAGPSIEEALSPVASELLEDFASSAADLQLTSTARDQWVRFIKHAGIDAAAIDPQLLSAYLEDHGFGADQIISLVHEYELGRRLLSDDEGRR